MPLPRIGYFAKVQLLLLTGLILGWLSGGLASADVTQCVVRDNGNYTIVVVCPKGLDQQGMRDAGVNACGDRLPCAAWIWDDTDKAPETAPSTPEEFTQEQVASAKGIWVNETEQLIMISEDER